MQRRVPTCQDSGGHSSLPFLSRTQAIGQTLLRLGKRTEASAGPAGPRLSEGSTATLARHWGSREQSHPLSQLHQPPREAGMCLGEGEFLAPQLGSLKGSSLAHSMCWYWSLRPGLAALLSHAPGLHGRPPSPPPCPGLSQGAEGRPEWTPALLCCTYLRGTKLSVTGSLQGRVEGQGPPSGGPGSSHPSSPCSPAGSLHTAALSPPWGSGLANTQD